MMLPAVRSYSGRAQFTSLALLFLAEFGSIEEKYLYKCIQKLVRLIQRRLEARLAAKQARVSSAFDSEPVLMGIVSYLDCKTLCAASQINKLWNKFANDDSLWDNLCWNDFNINRSAYKYSHIGRGRSKDFYCYCLQTFNNVCYSSSGLNDSRFVNGVRINT